MMTILDLRGGNEIDVFFKKSVVVICIEGVLLHFGNFIGVLFFFLNLLRYVGYSSTRTCVSIFNSVIV